MTGIFHGIKSNHFLEKSFPKNHRGSVVMRVFLSGQNWLKPSKDNIPFKLTFSCFVFSSDISMESIPSLLINAVLHISIYIEHGHCSIGMLVYQRI